MAPLLAATIDTGIFEPMKWGEAVPVVSAAVALASLLIVVFKEFVARGRLLAQLEHVGLLRLADDKRDALALDIIADDLLAETPSPQANAILARATDVRRAVSGRNRDLIKGSLVEASRNGALSYEATPALAARYFADKRLSPTFYVPMLVSNEGRRHLHVSGIVLLATSPDHPNGQWAFVAFFEGDQKKILQRFPLAPEIDRIAGLFAGFSVPPGGTVRTDPLFLPLYEADKRPISPNSMPPGEYDLQATFYCGRSKRAAQTTKVRYMYSAERIVASLNGTDHMMYLNSEARVIDAVDSTAKMG